MECKNSPDELHCFHITEILFTDPLQEKQKCCWCGEVRIAVRQSPHYLKHGKFVPSLSPSVVESPRTDWIDVQYYGS